MRKAIVEILKRAGDNFISGESIAGELGITRTAVWTHIQKLRENGYYILSLERRGYKLKDAPDLLFPSEIQVGLETEIIGKNMYYYPSVNSTNRTAKSLAYHGAPDGAIVVAEGQENGKGRLDRKFFSPRGKGIWFSVILRPKFLPHDAPKCTLMAAVAVAEAMNRFNLKAEIKWPNDIMYDGRKLVGILTEITCELSKITYIVVGIGINVNMSREDFPEEFIYWKEIVDKLGIEDMYKFNLARTEVLDQFENIFEKYDLILSPISCVSSLLNRNDRNTKGPDSINGKPVENLIGWTQTFLANFAGNPSASVPAGFSKENVPVGLQITGRRHEDSLLLKAAKQYYTEKAQN